MPDELVQKKKKELKELKKAVKSRKEAEKYSLRYKKVKFIEKRKVIRAIEKLDKQLKGKDLNSEEKQKLTTDREGWQEKLLYIDNFPLTWKYVSLFAKAETEEKQV